MRQSDIYIYIYDYIYNEETGQLPDQGIVFKSLSEGHWQKVAYTSPQHMFTAWFGDMPRYKEGAFCS